MSRRDFLERAKEFARSKREQNVARATPLYAELPLSEEMEVETAAMPDTSIAPAALVSVKCRLGARSSKEDWKLNNLAPSEAAATAPLHRSVHQRLGTANAHLQNSPALAEDEVAGRRPPQEGTSASPGDIRARLGGRRERRFGRPNDCHDDDDRESFVAKRRRLDTRDLIDCFQEYDIDQMEFRADRFSDMGAIKARAERFEEDTANELVKVTEAKRKNLRLFRFREEGDQESESEDE